MKALRRDYSSKEVQIPDTV